MSNMPVSQDKLLKNLQQFKKENTDSYSVKKTNSIKQPNSKSHQKPTIVYKDPQQNQQEKSYVYQNITLPDIDEKMRVASRVQGISQALLRALGSCFSFIGWKGIVIGIIAIVIMMNIGAIIETLIILFIGFILLYGFLS